MKPLLPLLMTLSVALPTVLGLTGDIETQEIDCLARRASIIYRLGVHQNRRGHLQDQLSEKADDLTLEQIIEINEVLGQYDDLVSQIFDALAEAQGLCDAGCPYCAATYFDIAEQLLGQLEGILDQAAQLLCPTPDPNPDPNPPTPLVP